MNVKSLFYSEEGGAETPLKRRKVEKEKGGAHTPRKNRLRYKNRVLNEEVETLRQRVANLTAMEGDEPTAGAEDQPAAGCQDQPAAGANDQPAAGANDQPAAGANDQPAAPVHATEELKAYKVIVEGFEEVAQETTGKGLQKAGPGSSSQEATVGVAVGQGPGHRPPNAH